MGPPRGNAARMTLVVYADMTPGQKSWHTKKWRAAQQQSLKTARNAKTFARYALTQAGWRVISFDTRAGYEYKGVADLVAVRRNNQAPDEITVMLVQVKGGKARLALGEIDRLRTAAKRVRLKWNVAEKRGKAVRFRKSIEPAKRRPKRSRA